MNALQYPLYERYATRNIFRIEDIVAHSLIANDEQILFVGDYQNRIKSPIITTANELEKEENSWKRSM